MMCSCHRDPTPHANPNPSRWITLSVDASGLPLKPESANLTATYAVSNLSCLKPLPISGALPMPTHVVDIAVRPVADKMFEAKVALDAYRDEDYEGRGPCHWRLSIAAFTLNDKGRQLEFSVAGPVIERLEPSTRYFPGQAFGADNKNPSRGIGDPAAVQRSPGEPVYPVTLSAKEASRD
jgi:hypothetical protein